MSSNTQSSAPPPPPAAPPHAHAHDDEHTQKKSPKELEAQKEAQQELSLVLKPLKHDPTLNGIWALGKDGILRSLTADREVVDAVALRPELIKAFVDRMPYNAQNEIDYRGVDGTTVPREQWFHPEDRIKACFPPPFTPPEERRNLSSEQLEKNRQWLEERAEKPSCEPRTVSNHDLGLKRVSDIESG